MAGQKKTTDEKETFNKKQKAELLESFGKSLDDQSCRIIKKFMKSGKDLNKMLLTAHKYRHLC